MLKIAVCDDDVIAMSALHEKISNEFKHREIVIQTECFSDGTEFLEQHNISPF